MHENRKEHDIAAVDEEPTSSATANREINQGNPEETRATGKKHDTTRPQEKQPGPAGHDCCDCG
jgi:hypothetical protein